MYFEQVDRQKLKPGMIESLDGGHRRIEEHQLLCSEVLNDYLDWPGIQRVFELKCTTFNKKDACLKKSGNRLRNDRLGRARMPHFSRNVRANIGA